MAVDVPTTLIVEPERLAVELEIAPPPLVVTTVTATQLEVSPARWERLVDGTAAFAAKVKVVADGPIGLNTTLMLIAPPGVKRLEFSPSAIHRAEQVISVRAIASLKASGPNELKFVLQPTKSQGPIEILCPDPLVLQVPGPKPARVAFACRGEVLPLFELAVDDMGQPQRIPTRLVLHGAAASAADGLSVSPRGKGALQVASSALTLGKESTVSLVANKAEHGSFFRDRSVSGTLVCDPGLSNGAILGCEQRVVLKQDAPFKAVLFWTACVTLGLLVIIVPSRSFWRIYSSTSSGGEYSSKA